MILPKIFILVILCQSVYGWVSYSSLARHASYPGDCYIPNEENGILPAHLTPIVIGGGKTYKLPAAPKQCFEARCQSGGLEVEYIGCGVVGGAKDCEKNKKKQYPDCCPTTKC